MMMSILLSYSIKFHCLNDEIKQPINLYINQLMLK